MGDRYGNTSLFCFDMQGLFATSESLCSSDISRKEILYSTILAQ